ncbi:hypothetical protein [Endozoicomonas sp. GU-1]|uniref:hypothetical protein n=1 Tax=Endozoicomonas sp. GU-1 TaxID=3009078 RepID=UPI0022B494C5|nr:hypothetical protein [Endozoicomonas sp. GU-1]WBA81578.1 hypothetical protein O2T12_25470 [Endozoicomonas sp. GU-1]
MNESSIEFSEIFDDAQVAELVDALASGAGVCLTVRRFVFGLLSLKNKGLQVC